MSCFGMSEGFTVGVEEEFQIIDPETGSLVSRVDEVLGKAGPGYEDNVQSEIFQSVVETATPVCRDIDELREEMIDLRETIAETLETKGYGMVASGTHPFARWEDQDITDRERYHELVEELKWVAKRELAFGQHVHVALQSEAQAIYVLNGIRPFLPLILAISANSPFWKGEDTGLQATRMRIFDALPRTGLPPRFDDWAAFEDTFTKLKAGGSLQDISKLWWDIRPRADLGTVELRIADLPTRLEESIDIAALSLAFVAGLARRHNRGEPLPFDPEREIVDENRWRAIRHGLDAEFIRWGVEDPGEDEIEEIPCQEMFDNALVILDDVVDDLGLRASMDRLERFVHDGQSGADRQIAIHDKTGDLSEVVLELARMTRP